jgi:thiamine pyrophosphate-dependent acetolactate synthase large subunit-like protein
MTLTVPEQTTGADCLMRALLATGTNVVFGMPGGAILPAYDALLHTPELRHVLVRHEQGAGYAAAGYAQTTGRVGVCMATSGPGATNLVTAVADAYAHEVPMVVITGQVPASLLGKDGFQEVDICGLTRNVTRHNFLVTDASRITAWVADAFAIAAGEHPGPVLVDITKDALQSSVLTADLPPASPVRTRGFPDYPQAGLPHPDGLSASGVVDALEQCRGDQTVFVTGGGLARATAERLPGPQTMHTPGYAVPAAIGAAFGNPGHTVWAVTTAACFLTTGRELVTAAVNGVAVKVAVLRDRQDPAVDLVGMAEAMGCAGLRCHRAAESETTVRQATAVQDRPVLVDFALTEPPG